MSLNNSSAPSTKEIIHQCRKIYFPNKDEDAVLSYLAEIASYDYSNIDKCDEWATEFMSEYEDEITIE